MKNQLTSIYKVLMTCLILGVAILGCEVPAELLNEQDLGTIRGRIMFGEGDYRAGIIVTLDKTDGFVTNSARSVARQIAEGVEPSGLFIAETTTDASGFFNFSNLEPGIYTIQAFSPDSPERAVLTNITVESGVSTLTNMMLMMPVGSVYGQIIVDNNESFMSNLGFLVFITGTSFMAVTDINGNFEISNIPIGNDYEVLILKGYFYDTWSPEPVVVIADEKTPLTPQVRHLTSAEINVNIIRRNIQRAIAQAKTDYLDGAAPGRAIPVILGGTGIDLQDDITMNFLFDAITGYYVHLDFTGVSGSVFPNYVLSNSINKSRILSVILDDAVKTIGASAFFNFTGLRDITANGVTRIESNAFIGNSNLIEIYFPEVISVGNNAFAFCTNLQSVNLPSAISIGTDAFLRCNNITILTLPQITSWDGIPQLDNIQHLTLGVSSVPANQFAHSTNLTRLELPNVTSTQNIPTRQLHHITLGLNNIGNSAFRDHSNLISVSFPAATSIDHEAFYRNTSLISVSFPAVTSIGGWAFYRNTSLTSVSFPAATSIANSAFEGNTSLTSVSFPAVTSIGDWAFYLNISLTSVSFPAVTIIGNSAFSGNISLTSVEFPAATSIYAGAFWRNTSLTSVSFPAVTSIGYWAFYRNTRLTSVSFPAVTSIGREAFSGNTSLTSVTLGTITYANFSSIMSFPGNLREVYFATSGTAGTFVTDNPGDNPTWRRE